MQRGEPFFNFLNFCFILFIVPSYTTLRHYHTPVGMSRDTFAFTSASLRSLRLEQELQDWEDARRALAHRRAMTRPPLPAAPRLRHGNERIQTIRAPPPQIQCRDPAIHNIFMCGDMKRVYAVLRDPGMVNALMETVHEEMAWAPEMGMWTLISKVKQTSALRLAASRGHSGCVEELLFRGVEVNADPGGRTALHDGCSGGHHVCVHLLLDHGADPDVLSVDGNAPLHLCNAVETYQCAEHLVTNGALVNVTQKDTCITPLHVACRRGLEDHVELYLSYGGDVMAQSQEGETPLNAACAGAERPADAGRYLRIVQRLLAAGANAQTAGKKKHTALHNACGNCSPRIVEILLKHGAQADVANCAGYTPMDCLLQVIEDYPDQQPNLVARLLLNYGAQPASTRMLKLCLLSPDALEVMLNCYAVVPACDEWFEDIPEELQKEHQCFLDTVRQMSGQPRSLQHLCRCALRRHLGSLCHFSIQHLDIPCALKDYLLLQNDGQLR
ncbi:ankyrin repeat and SOCS box protein 16 isoform X2 [Triplophysa dalaica]|uniref:ankyrin repeat and SOCS box protein 16 isoform X2 n=1 Tax=Triplophysa dalaica TaxID=1582913 RepID=UPI0024DF34C9|nr:ankyrin repeat and SOCS box protein 16 isoform X2 [Triplophysa dalaica]